MTSLAELARLKSIALAEDAKANGSFTMDCFWAWCNYNNALAQCVEADLAERQAKPTSIDATGTEYLRLMQTRSAGLCFKAANILTP